ncbi:hypothetical protein J437_LFUL002380 [Ladona fulva]|uniref:phenylalanine--tRNA ligase n=1 Tax=Ladona fulva TaxID=123851 RepID=A0A8K0K362_LADFU|nr:hypothetical protein J437_LFUL002380 [Ladona fulva]
MPNVVLSKSKLFKEIGKSFEDDEFIDICFDFGLEVELVRKILFILYKGHDENEEPIQLLLEDVNYVIEVPANRPDLLSIEGIAYALRSYLKIEEYPGFSSINPKQKIQMFVQEKVQEVRPHVVAVIFRDVTFTPDNYASFIDLQEKLSASVGKKRSLVAIGAHDLDTIQPPFYYDALLPEEIKFCPLNQEKLMTGPEILEFYSHHAQLKQYVSLLKDLSHYPIIKDKNGVVLSLPPLINGDHTKITLNTRNVFVECTALCKTKALIILETLSCLFSRYCARKYVVEKVEIQPLKDCNPVCSKFENFIKYRTQITVHGLNAWFGAWHAFSFRGGGDDNLPEQRHHYRAPHISSPKTFRKNFPRLSFFKSFK